MKQPNKNKINPLLNGIADIYRKVLKDNGAVASGNLSRFQVSFKWTGRYFEIYFELPLYWKYAPENERKSDKMPPVSAIEKWITQKKIEVPVNSKGVPQLHSLAYVIARDIGENGWNNQPRNLLQKALNSPEMDEAIEKLLDELLNLITDDIDKDIEEL